MTRVLIVEDSPTQAFQIRSKLVAEGYHVKVAENGRKALEAIPRFWPHLVLTDMQMPVLGGLELVAECRDSFPVIPLILMTSRGSDEIAAEALRLGAAAYLPKSLLEDQLFATMDDVLDVMEVNQSHAELIGSLEFNELRFNLRNDPKLIRPLVDLIKEVGSGLGLFDDAEAVRAGMAVKHAIQNAMLHGNLELSTEEVEAAGEIIVEGEPSLIERRAADPDYCDRRVHVTAQLTADEVKIVVRDEGPGFTLQTIPAATNVDLLDPENGRGLVLIRSMMDEVELNDVGNEITMVKYRSGVPEALLS